MDANFTLENLDINHIKCKGLASCLPLDCNTRFENDATESILHVLAAIYAAFIPFTTLSNLLYMFGIWSTKRDNKLSLIDKLLLAQSAIDFLVGLVSCPSQVYEHLTMKGGCALSPNITVYLAFTGTGWIINKLSSCAVLIISQNRLLTVMGRDLHKYMRHCSTMVVSMTVVLVIASIGGHLIAFTEMRSIAMKKLFTKSSMFLDVTLICLVVLFNCLLLQHVQRNAMPATSNSISYERQLSKTILLVNFILFVFWFPNVTSTLTFAYILEWKVPITLKQYRIFSFTGKFLHLALFGNCGVNAIVYYSSKSKD